MKIRSVLHVNMGHPVSRKKHSKTTLIRLNEILRDIFKANHIMNIAYRLLINRHQKPLTSGTLKLQNDDFPVNLWPLRCNVIQT